MEENCKRHSSLLSLLWTRQLEKGVQSERVQPWARVLGWVGHGLDSKGLGDLNLEEPRWK